MKFWVYDEKKRNFIHTPHDSVICPECGATAEDMSLDLIDRVRGNWMLQCECGEQFHTHND